MTKLERPRTSISYLRTSYIGLSLLSPSFSPFLLHARSPVFQRPSLYNCRPPPRAASFSVWLSRSSSASLPSSLLLSMSTEQVRARFHHSSLHLLARMRFSTARILPLLLQGLSSCLALSTASPSALLPQSFCRVRDRMSRLVLSRRVPFRLHCRSNPAVCTSAILALLRE